jgi:2-amino-4-hydroxy-6-hydroxymethyldihydropteridine diphosphokinase
VSKIEQKLGRRRLVFKGPRTIDIDILLYAKFVIRTPSLIVPHERLIERRFVLAPLLELAPDLRDPVSRRPLRDCLGAVAGQAIRKVDFHPVIPR